jgi:hypothetical protein
MRRALVAVNTAPDSENQMHGDEARRYGFSSGLVPGVDVLAYLAHEGVARWGAGWLGGGRMVGRLGSPVYDGEAVVVEATDDDGCLRAEVRGTEVRGAGVRGAERQGADAAVRATAQLFPADAAAADRADPAAFEVVAPPDPDPRPPATGARLEPGTALATQWATFHSARAEPYLDEISEDHPAIRTDGLAHPGWLLRFANWSLSGTVRLGPWIHVESDLWLLRPVADGDQLEVRARVTHRFERKGHQFIDLDVLHLVDGRPVAFVDHRAIWRPRVSSP